MLTPVVVALNAVANALGRWLLAPVAALPGWLSATIVGAVTGVLLLLMFKYTSRQKSIKKVRDDIKANLLALKLFKESAVVALKAQGGILIGAFWLFVFALVPMIVMMVPVLLFLGQLALWYQKQPLHVGEEAVVTLKINGDKDAAWPKIALEPTNALDVDIGPVKVVSEREVCWNIKAKEKGLHHLVFQVGDEKVDKELAVGDGFMRVSEQRPGWAWFDVLTNPWEKPFSSDSQIESIKIVYPERSSWVDGTDTWVIYWFIVSFVAAILFRKVFNVNV